MNTTNLHRFVLPVGALLLLVLAGCRPDPGPNPYGAQENFLDDEEEFLEGPDPYDGSEPRLSLSVFYEGGASQTIAVDGVSRHYYIYSNEATGVVTFSQEPDDDRVEGFVSDRIVISGNPWWGGGVHWDVPQDIRGWRTMNVSLKSDDASFDDLRLAIDSADGSIGSVPVADYGYVGNGQWHTLAIPLADFVANGANLAQVSIVLRFDGVGGEAGESLLVDNLYLSP